MPPLIYNGNFLYGEFVDIQLKSARDNSYLCIWGDEVKGDEKSPLKKLAFDFNNNKIQHYVIKYNDYYLIEMAYLNEVLLNDWFVNEAVNITAKRKYPNELLGVNNIDILHTEDVEIVKEDDPNQIELKFLETFEKVVNSDHLYYDKKDLINFHTAVKTGNLVILSGMSGTGKSKIVKEYGKALNISDENKNQFRIIPVKANWNDDSDLIGFLDTINNIYRPSTTGLVDILIKAHCNPELMHIICFDEMNLSRVEHLYLSSEKWTIFHLKSTPLKIVKNNISQK